jgi:hypothetical protein
LLARRLSQAFNTPMSPKYTNTGGWGCRRWTHRIAALALAWGGSALAQDVVSVPAAHLHHAEGSVAYAPQGDKEWHDVQPRRLLKRGDRLWTDRGSRAEMQAGGHAVRLNGETQLVLENVGETATQLSLTQGSIVATVTRMNPGDSFEVGTPNLAFRARQPGDYRIDVDTKQGVTRLVVLSGLAVVYGEKGEAMEVRSGQRAVFRERTLARVQQPLFAATDDFDRWAGARRRGEPTVSMPVIGRNAPAPAPAPATAFVNKGRDIIISGSAAEVAASTGIPAKGSSRVLAPQAPGVAAQASAKPIPTTASVQAPASAKPIPTTASVQPAPLMKVMIPTAPAAATSAQIQAQVQAGQAQLQAQAAAQAQARAAAQAQARAASQAQAAARELQDRQRRLAAQQREEQRRASVRADQERRSVAAAEARRAEERRRGVASRRMEEDRQHASAAREAEQKRQLAAKHAEEERRQAVAKRAAEERRLMAVRRAETQKIIDAQKLAESRRQQLARLQEQARRDELSVQGRREQQARRAEEERRDDQARRDDAARHEEQARREEDYRRQRALADQVRRDQARRDEEVWLRQQQQNQPSRPVPMGVPIRRVS